MASSSLLKNAAPKPRARRNKVNKPTTTTRNQTQIPSAAQNSLHSLVTEAEATTFDNLPSGFSAPNLNWTPAASAWLPDEGVNTLGLTASSGNESSSEYSSWGLATHQANGAITCRPTYPSPQPHHCPPAPGPRPSLFINGPNTGFSFSSPSPHIWDSFDTITSHAFPMDSLPYPDPFASQVTPPPAEATPPTPAPATSPTTAESSSAGQAPLGQTAREVALASFPKAEISDPHRVADLPAQRHPVLRLQRKLNLRRKGNMDALLCHIAGDQAPKPCRSCANSRGPWTTCVVKEGHMFGSCANCWYNSSGTRCCFHDANSRLENSLRNTASSSLGAEGTSQRAAEQASPYDIGSTQWRTHNAIGKMVNETTAGAAVSSEKNRHIRRIRAAAKELGLRIAEYEQFLKSSAGQRQDGGQ